jgi:hypothetical protein
LTDWGRVLHDDDLAHAITDRVLERGRQLTLDGPSIRTRHLGLEDNLSSEASVEAARLSGIQRPDFSEPTIDASRDKNVTNGNGSERSRVARHRRFVFERRAAGAAKKRGGKKAMSINRTGFPREPIF